MSGRFVRRQTARVFGPDTVERTHEDTANAHIARADQASSFPGHIHDPAPPPIKTSTSSMSSPFPPSSSSSSTSLAQQPDSPFSMISLADSAASSFDTPSTNTFSRHDTLRSRPHCWSTPATRDSTLYCSDGAAWDPRPSLSKLEMRPFPSAVEGVRSAARPEPPFMWRGGRPYHNWGDAAPWPVSYSQLALDGDVVWHQAMKMYRGGSNILPGELKRPPRRVLDLGCGVGTWCLDVARTLWPDAEVWGLDLVPIQPDVAMLGDPDLSQRIHWVHANFLEEFPFEDGFFDFVHMRFVGLGIPETKFYHVLDEAFRVLSSDGYLEVHERSYPFIAGRLPLPPQDPATAPPAEKHSYPDLENVYESVLTAHTINPTPLTVLASAIVLYDTQSLVQDPITSGTCPAPSYAKRSATSRLQELRYRPWGPRAASGATRDKTASALDYAAVAASPDGATKLGATLEPPSGSASAYPLPSPAELDYRLRLFTTSCMTTVQEASDWLWDQFVSKGLALSSEPATKDRERGNRRMSEVPAPPRRLWNTKEAFDAEVAEWASDLARRAGTDLFLEELCGWEDGREETYAPGGRKLVGARTWRVERTLESEGPDDKLGTWQMCGFRAQKR